MQTKNKFKHLKKLLYPLSAIYYLFIFFRNLLFDYNIVKQNKLLCPVISIGNISTGGSGKTPMVIYLVNLLKKNNLKVGILTRGYGRLVETPIIICNENKKIKQNLNFLKIGDEPLLLFEKLNGVPIGIDKNRFRTGKILLKNYNLDVIVLDDGFQHRSLYRDFEVVLINSLHKKRNHKLLPVGFLRESFSSLKRTDCIIVTKNNLSQPQNKLIEKIKNFQPNIYYSRSINNISKIFIPKINALELLKNKKAYLLSGIGDPLSFQLSIKSLSKNIVGHCNLKDHFNYSQKDLNEIEIEAKKKNADFILTTEKDWVKLKSLNSKMPVLPVNLELSIDDKVNGLSFKELINDKIKFETYHRQKRHPQKLT